MYKLSFTLASDLAGNVGKKGKMTLKCLCFSVLWDAREGECKIYVYQRALSGIKNCKTQRQNRTMSGGRARKF